MVSFKFASFSNIQQPFVVNLYAFSIQCVSQDQIACDPFEVRTRFPDLFLGVVLCLLGQNLGSNVPQN